MKIKISNNMKIWGPPPPIYFKPDTTIRKTPSNKADFLKVDLKTKPGDTDNKMVAIYMPLLRTSTPEALLKFITLLNRILKGKYLSTVTQKYGMARNIMVAVVLQVFEKETRDFEMETNGNNKLVIKDVISHFFPSKDLKNHAI